MSGKVENSEQTERSALLNEKERDIESALRQASIEDATNHLINIALSLIIACITASALFLARQYVPKSIPLWVPFLIFWVGHGVAFLIGIRTIQLVFKSLMPTPGGNRWQRSNEKRISLAQFTLYHLLWTTAVATILLVFEILLY